MRCFILLLIIVLSSCNTKQTQALEEPLPIDNSAMTTKVGTKFFTWTDSSRNDKYYGGKRMVNVQVWYPVDEKEKAENFVPAPYYYRIQEAAGSLDNWSPQDLALVAGIETKGLVGAPISKGDFTYPLLLFSPGLGGNLSVYSYYAEQLTQLGYVVVGVNHLYESEYVIDQAGTVIPVNVTFHDSLKTLDIPAEITADEYRLVKGVRQKVLGEDLIFCLDKITALNAAEFSDQIDLSRVGAWGHSIGGAAAVYAAYLDPRFEAILNLDGTPPSVTLAEGITPPFMFIEDLTDYKNHQGYAKMHQRRSDFCAKVKGDAYRVLLAGTNHNSFLDYNYHAAESKADKANALGVLEQTQSYMQGFFDHYLQGKPLNIKATATEELEVMVFR